LVCGAVLAFARVPAWETGGVGTVCQRAASRMCLRRPACGFQGGDRCPHEKLCTRVHTRNHRALRGATGRSWLMMIVLLLFLQKQNLVLRVCICSPQRVYMRGFQGVIVTRVCTCVCRVPWRAALVVPCTSPIVGVCHWLVRSAWDPMSLAFVRLRGPCAVLVVRRLRTRPYVL
jgi:hypothetical protein